MASEKDNGLHSDTEGGEKPVREQLKKAHINASATDDQSEQYTSNEENAAGTLHPRGRLHRKRSHEEVDVEVQDVTSEPPRHHTRKRSRDSTQEEDQLNNGQRKVSGERSRDGDDESVDTSMNAEEPNGAAKPPRTVTPEASGEKRSEAAVEAMASPKTKRSRLHSTTTEDSACLADPSEASVAGNSAEAETTAGDVVSEPKPDIPADKESLTKVPPTSGFANTSAASPFGSLAGGKSPSGESQTTPSAFAASGFSALAGSSTSGFGAIGKQSGGFGSGGTFASGTKSLDKNDKPKSPPANSFGGALGQTSAFSSTPGTGSGFGSGSSGFGKLGSSGGLSGGIGGTGFGSLGGGGLKSFASGKTVAPLGGLSKPAKPFGAPPADGEEDGGDADDEDDRSGAKSPLATEDEKQDERFFAQEVETGEEDEITALSTRAKLYNFAEGPDGKKEWKERGLGVLRLNVKKPTPDGDGKPRGRMLMRADGSHRVVLNTPITKEIKFGSATGEPPQGGLFLFMGTIDGKEGLELLQLKVRLLSFLKRTPL